METEGISTFSSIFALFAVLGCLGKGVVVVTLTPGSGFSALGCLFGVLPGF